MEKNVDGAAAVDMNSLDIMSDENLDEYEKSLANLSRGFLKLSGANRQILRYFIENYESGDMLTNSEIARKAGVHPATVQKAMINSEFSDVISEIMPKIMKSKSPFMLGKLIKHADKSVKAIELWTRFTGQYTPTERKQNINVNINQFSDDDQGKLDNILTKLLDLGHNPDDIYVRMCELTGRVIDGEVIDKPESEE